MYSSVGILRFLLSYEVLTLCTSGRVVEKIVGNGRWVLWHVGIGSVKESLWLCVLASVSRSVFLSLYLYLSVSFVILCECY